MPRACQKVPILKTSELECPKEPIFLLQEGGRRGKIRKLCDLPSEMIHKTRTASHFFVSSKARGPTLLCPRRITHIMRLNVAWNIELFHDTAQMI